MELRFMGGIITAPDGWRVTEEWLRVHANGQAGWSAAQLRILGITWPPRKGWLKKIIGTRITFTAKSEFQRLRKPKDQPAKPQSPGTEAGKCWGCKGEVPKLFEVEGEQLCAFCFTQFMDKNEKAATQTG